MRQFSASDIEENRIFFDVVDERNFSIVSVNISNDSIEQLIGLNNGSALIYVTTLSEQFTLDESQNTSMVLLTKLIFGLYIIVNRKITFCLKNAYLCLLFSLL